ncbi:MAG: hypothetical protein MJE63_19210 [Proteobacteria bacterium]|nr:hypothetical protein [Pseudomonadota bacterium]
MMLQTAIWRWGCSVNFRQSRGAKEYMLKFYQEAAEDYYGKAWLKAGDYVRSKGYPASVYGEFSLGGKL